jgi:hypothetical protein
MELDVSKQGPAYALQGGRGLSGNTSNDALSLLDAIRGLGKTVPMNQLATRLHGYGVDMSDEDLRRLVTTSDSEYNQLRSSYRRDAASENIPDKTAKAWQDFTEQMQRAKEEIFKTFVSGLLPLEKPLEHLSGGFTKFVEVLLKSDLVKESIEGMASWLEKFSGHISAPKFLDSVQQFTSNVGALADAISDAADFVSHPGHGIAHWLAPGLYTNDDLAKGGRKAKSAYLSYLTNQEAAARLPEGMLARQWAAESGQSFNVADSAKGAVGAFQLLPATAKQYGVDPTDPKDAAWGAAQYDSDLLKKYKGNLAEALAAYNWGPGNVDAAIRQHGKDWLAYAPKETQNYVMKQGGRANGVDINIYNNTGGSATVTASGLAH